MRCMTARDFYAAHCLATPLAYTAGGVAFAKARNRNAPNGSGMAPGYLPARAIHASRSAVTDLPPTGVPRISRKSMG